MVRTAQHNGQKTNDRDVVIHSSLTDDQAAVEEARRFLSIDPEEVDRYLRAYVCRTGGHWIWRGQRDAGGYGVCTFQSQQWRAHRLVWTMVEGPLSASQVLHHECPLKACVFPGHLRAFGSHADHMSHEWADPTSRLSERRGRTVPR